MFNDHNLDQCVATHKIADLICKLKENKKKHIEAYNLAVRRFKEAQIRWFEKNLAAAKEGGRAEVAMKLPRPMNCAKNYDEVMQWMELQVGDEVEMNYATFAKIVQDRWDWTIEFGQRTGVYGARNQYPLAINSPLDRSYVPEGDESLEEIPLD